MKGHPYRAGGFFFRLRPNIPGATIGPDGLHRVFLHPR